MVVLVINTGSSSLKFTLFSMPDEKMLATGQVERLGLESPHLIYKRSDGKSVEENVNVSNHAEALKEVCDKLLDPEVGTLKSLSEVEAIGHRVVHGGEKFTASIKIDDEVRKIIRDCFSLAPLHNPPNMLGIEACEQMFPNVSNVAVFDTAFHQTMQPEAYLYAVPAELYEKHAVRKYGFHGTSHRYVAHATADFLDTPYEELKMITCHLGNGCSMAAIDRGKVIDTTMGMTPLDGLVMGTRCGDIDPGVVIRLMEIGMSTAEIDKLLNKQSGLLGVACINSSDMRDIIEASEKGCQKADLALKMFARRIVKHTGSYYALLNGADALVFTGGIGEYCSVVRKMVMDQITALNTRIDEEQNNLIQGKPGIISTSESQFKALVMPTNEELMIARETAEILN